MRRWSCLRAGPSPRAATGRRRSHPPAPCGSPRPVPAGRRRARCAARRGRRQDRRTRSPIRRAANPTVPSTCPSRPSHRCRLSRRVPPTGSSAWRDRRGRQASARAAPVGSAAAVPLRPRQGR
ncbi:hypothetical protein FMM06_05025 [Glacieibacterium frigidum]|uniref:Uncharacterized protein n=1 Tax=Glacieibacterium frigidum TaxID=2593303 RepID=A0A552UJN3_9SPHN|nr:hypothetical protein FMM06_05025 [Glacieibacterium frigidum]